MKDKKPIPEVPGQPEAQAPVTYRTGQTHPPKSHGGIIAFLLVLIIFLSGIVTILSLMNIRLFQQLTQLKAEETSPVIFAEKSDVEAQPESVILYPLGFSGMEVTPFWQTYRDLPAGIYVVEVTGQNGLLPGDILTAFNGVSVTGAEDFHTQLALLSAGDTAEATICRGGTDLTFTLTLQEE